MQFFAFTLAWRGLEVVMFRFTKHTTELVPIFLVEGGVGWYSVCDPFVHKTMCELITEVQTDVRGLQWAYEYSQIRIIARVSRSTISCKVDAWSISGDLRLCRWHKKRCRVLGSNPAEASRHIENLESVSSLAPFYTPMLPLPFSHSSTIIQSKSPPFSLHPNTLQLLCAILDEK
ncbi:hypothetical protein C8R44DRAFT_751352 [Mycena epipterygia]|nr:hypothetical protein C8R44DRAFT_751352 [Mycena epipterygia]